MADYKTTFNYLLTHRVIPQLYFDNIDLFYEKVIANPKNMELFLKNALEMATAFAKDHPEVEPDFPPSEEHFFTLLWDEGEGRKLLLTKLPAYEKDMDCSLLAIPADREHAGYFTCERSTNVISGDRCFMCGAWSPGEGGNLVHSNYGEINGSSHGDFTGMVARIAYERDGGE